MLCHGFTQNAASWGPFGTLLGEHRTVVAVDLPGHGGSGHVAGTLEEAAEDILDLMGADPFDLVGYSMGGRVGLTMALRHPPSLRRLAMIGATAGLTSAAQRADRRAADERLALQLEDEGLIEVVSNESGRSFQLTEQGRSLVAKEQRSSAPGRKPGVDHGC